MRDKSSQARRCRYVSFGFLMSFSASEGDCRWQEIERVMIGKASFDLLEAVQTALTLATGEEACEFEHRDLHWGNILLRTQAPDTLHCKLRYTPKFSGHHQICKVRASPKH